jgi:hypothetical protein
VNAWRATSSLGEDLESGFDFGCGLVVPRVKSVVEWIDPLLGLAGRLWVTRFVVPVAVPEHALDFFGRLIIRRKHGRIQPVGFGLALLALHLVRWGAQGRD